MKFVNVLDARVKPYIREVVLPFYNGMDIADDVADGSDKDFDMGLS